MYIQGERNQKKKFKSQTKRFTLMEQEKNTTPKGLDTSITNQDLLRNGVFCFNIRTFI